ncbi:MAG: hypothetical protein ABW110_00955 [Steroidobacteraceae bacterium]
MSSCGGSGQSVARVLAEAAITLGGIIILVWAASAGPAWVDRHFLPDYFHPQSRRHDLALILRLVVGASGVAIIVLLRPAVGRVVMAGRSRALLGGVARLLVAVGLALLVSEAVLRTAAWKPRHEAPAGREPIQQSHAHLGWTLVPNHVGSRFIGGRNVEYATDAFGYRVRCPECTVDPQQPSVLFTGESIMLGTGLHWGESVPAQVAAVLRVQSVNLAVNGYATDQTYLRLAAELPRFSRPVAVVSIFAPSLMPRNLNVDRPHLDAHLRWQPAVIPWRVQMLANRLLAYNSSADLERAIAVTRAALQATAYLAHSRQAAALVLVPRYPHELPIEQELRQRILDEGGMDYVVVDLDPSWRLSDDDHPDARAARAMAVAVAKRLRAMHVGQL